MATSLRTYLSTAPVPLAPRACRPAPADRSTPDELPTAPGATHPLRGARPGRTGARSGLAARCRTTQSERPTGPTHLHPHPPRAGHDPHHAASPHRHPHHPHHPCPA